MVWGALGAACSSARSSDARAPTEAPRADAPLSAHDPGAWFDARGNLTVVGPGRRLRLVLSAPIAVCGSALEKSGSPAELVESASLPFHVLSEACREAHPTILLAEESATASPAELEHSYHEVARCAAADFGLTDGWIPDLIAKSDPCPVALGLGWRLPTQDELMGLTVDDRKAVAGALFDAEEKTALGGLLLYARSPGGELGLVTLSPNAAERPPELDLDSRARPLPSAALRCVNDGAAASLAATPPVLPHAGACLREQRGARGSRDSGGRFQPAPDVQKLKRWLEANERAPNHLDALRTKELSELLASPAIERLAREAREERALTERYGELADGLDDPGLSPAERERRHAEFDNLRRRLSGQIVQSAESAGADRTLLSALLARVELLLELSQARPQKKTKLDYASLLTRVRTLSGKRAP